MPTAARLLHCPDCVRPMRTLTLTGHYQRTVTIDVCESCTLIWFDQLESVELAGPGVADLVDLIHQAVRAEAPLAPLPSSIACPVCAAPTHSAFNMTRFGRTAELKCPQGHGYFQTFVLYLAEKGYIRPISWADIGQLADSRRRLFCAGCGAVLDDRPYLRCPYCQSEVGVLDPARLAAAIEVDHLIHASSALAGADTQIRQAHCPACGGSVDPTREASCPHCHAIIRRADT